MKKIFIGIVLGVVAVVALGITLRPKPTPSTTLTNSDTTQQLLGVSLSPSSFEADDFNTFWDHFPAAGNTVTWTGNVFDLREASGAPNVTHVLAGQRNLTPIIIAHLKPNEILTESQRQEAADLLADFARNYKPAFIGVGNEINFSYKDNADALTAFASWFPEVVATIHQRSPATRVFTVFQFEWLRGLHGGLFGGTSDETTAQWDLFNTLSAADIFAFTTYPGLVYASPSDIPETYYQELTAHTDKPIAFTESGWFRDGPPGWDSSVEEQKQFINRWATLTDPLHPRFRIWTFLYDQVDAPPPSETMGLLAADQSTSLAWVAWQSAIAGRITQD